MKSTLMRVSLVFVALMCFYDRFYSESQVSVKAHKTISDDEDEIENVPNEHGEASIDDMGEVVE